MRSGEHLVVDTDDYWLDKSIYQATRSVTLEPPHPNLLIHKGPAGTAVEYADRATGGWSTTGEMAGEIKVSKKGKTVADLVKAAGPFYALLKGEHCHCAVEDMLAILKRTMKRNVNVFKRSHE
ncbi:unnamed protein product [Gadus morhua 'NCC']